MKKIFYIDNLLEANLYVISCKRYLEEKKYKKSANFQSDLIL